MNKHYIEIYEETNDDNLFLPKEMLRLYVADEAEAEKVYADNIGKFTKVTKAKFIEEHHSENPKENKPCVAKEIKDGKIVN